MQQTYLQAPKAPFAHVRTNSLHSINTGKGFVDLLDAQSQFVPLQFQTRVKAEGARDYGEDVADRNLGENGTDLTSPQAQAFYALTGKNPCDGPDSFPPPIWTSTFGDNGQPFQPPARNESLDAARRKSQHTFINPLTQNPPFPSSSIDPSSNEPRSRISLHMSQPNRVGRRQSLSSYIPAAPSSPYADAASRPMSMHRPNRSANQLVEIDQRASLRSSTSSGLGIYSHPVPDMQPEPPAPSAPFARDSVMLAKTNYSLPSNSKTSERPYRGKHSGTRYSSRDGVLKDGGPSGSRDGTSAIVSPLQLNSSRNHLIDVGYDSVEEDDGWTDEFYLHTVDVPAASVSHTTQAGGTRKKTLEGPYQRAKSQGALHGRIRLDEIYEHIPVRTSSLNQCTAHTPITSPVRVHADFNIDDYLSSDDDIDADSFISHREEHDEREQGLLFRNTGYGGDGLQLPGLLDSIPAAPVPQIVRLLRHSRSTPLAGLCDANGGRRLTLGANTHAPGYATDEGDYGETAEEAGDFQREDLAPGRRGMKRISALGAVHQGQGVQQGLSSPIEEEKESKVDVRAAVRLRKEAKARERAGGKGVKARGRPRTRSAVRGDDGHTADFEM
ncbi:hypothetical protein ACHAQA_008794 [Verticillium albo-atrum]